MTIQSRHNIATLDIVITDGGMTAQCSPVAKVEPAELGSTFPRPRDGTGASFPGQPAIA